MRSTTDLATAQNPIPTAEKVNLAAVTNLAAATNLAAITNLAAVLSTSQRASQAWHGKRTSTSQWVAINTTYSLGCHTLSVDLAMHV